MSQPPPIPNNSTPLWDLVIADMRERDNFGMKRYGTPLQAGNGRDFLQDAYEEALDLAVYLRGAIEERKQVAAVEAFLVAELERREESGLSEYVVEAKLALEAFRGMRQR